MGLGDILFGKTEQARAIAADPLERIDRGEQATKALDFQEKNFGRAADAASQINISEQATARENINAALPGFDEFQGQLGDVFKDIATNPFELPDSVKSILKQQAAEAGISGGFGGQSEFGKFSQVRNLGLKSLELGNQRISQANSLFRTLVDTAPTINPVSPLSFLPSQQDFSATEEFNVGTVDAFNSQAKQQFLQAQENNRAAAASSKGIIGGVIEGAVSGFASGGPWGALTGGVAGGVADAAGEGGSSARFGGFVGGLHRGGRVRSATDIGPVRQSGRF